MINYDILHSSMIFYEGHGYERVEVPWTVTKAISAITKPADRIDFEIKHNEKVLTGSGEQGFLYLYLKGFLPKGRFQAITPCFRYEPFDFTHTKYFMKNELIDTLHPNASGLNEVVKTAKSFFDSYLADVKILQISDTQIDLMWREHELGSYGIRSCEFLDWVYGTGVAEPRFSSLVKLSRKQLQNGLSRT